MNPIQQKIIVFDLNGVLCEKRVKTYGSYVEDVHGPKPIYMCPKYDIYIKPYTISLLKRCSKKYPIAIWSSSSERNMAPFVKILIKKYRLKFLFIWYRDQTQLDMDYGIDPSVKIHDTIKDITQIVLSPTLNPERALKKEDILIVDDDWKKIRMNPTTYLVDSTFQVSSFMKYVHSVFGIEVSPEVSSEIIPV